MNPTSTLLSFVPMLKKFVKISCYMGLFFIASVSYAYDSWVMHPSAFSVGDINGQNGWVNITPTDPEDKILKGNISGVSSSLFYVSGYNSWTRYRNDTLPDLSSYNKVFFDVVTGAQTNYNVEHRFKVEYGTSTKSTLCQLTWETSDNSTRTHRFYVSGTNKRDLGFYASSTPVKITLELDILNGTCRAFTDSTTTPSISLPNTNGTPISSLYLELFSSSVSLDYKSFFSYINFKTSTSSLEDFTCPTCTRVVSHTPDSGETFPEVTGIPVFASVYIASSDVINQSNVYTKFYWNSVKSPAEYSGVGYGENDSQPSGTHQEQIFIFDEDYQTFPYLVDFDYATGTYKMKINIIERIYPPWWQFWNDAYEEKVLATTEYEFYVLQPTDYEELSQLSQQVIAQQEALALSNDCAREGFVSQACFQSYGKELVNTIKYAPPQGYAFLLVDKLMATTTGTSSISMLVSFPEGSPLRGHTLDLNMSSALGNSIAYIDSQDIETLPDGAMDTFMKYWNYFCYIMLGLWIIREVFGTFSIDFSYNANGGNYRRNGNIPVRSAHGKSLKINSYD